METENPLSSIQGRIFSINRKINELKDRIACGPDPEIKEKMISVIMELQEFRKMIELQQGEKRKFQEDNDLYLGKMEKTIYSGSRSFKEAIKMADRFNY